MQNPHTYLLPPHGNIPNNQQLPVLVYPQALQASDNLTSAFKDAFARNNWRGSWVNGVFSYHHYHSHSHEALGVAAGSAILMLGGPGGMTCQVNAGDLLVLPAGTGHCLQAASSGFKVVGAYPAGQEAYDICTEADDVEAKRSNIARVPMPKTDPVAGKDGPLLQHWDQA
ncbi:cupin domain-containing protein [Pontibacter mangrovi]|uniref:Cupin domain-containing protein n=1 Tax=Pontibacter mangrovi TaxID=2589816 RepID=A0A501W2N0_9BACT|nr:cupin domain-containing protein [Pontibacter mangrovi]TPE41067.1 cupin domain-containing protein [Pontibacter mangrovi]